MYTLLFSVLFLLIGLTIGVIANDRYREYVVWNTHEFEKIIKENPHPEIYDKNGKVNREEYTAITFDLGYDPSEDGFDEDNVYADH